MIEPTAVVRLPDGRDLACDVTGQPDGFPIVFHHGIGDSRLAHHPDEERTVNAGVRLITVDRPGYGRSSELPERTLGEWARDVEAVADHLGLVRFSVVGWSAGGPHALAAAHHMPERVKKVTLVSSLQVLGSPHALTDVGSSIRMMWRLRRVQPVLRLVLGREARKAQKNISAYAKRMIKSLPPADQRLLGDPRMRDMAEREMQEALRGGGAGVMGDLHALENWGFRPEDVSQPVALYHGDDDDVVGMATARTLSAMLPDATLHELRGQGHWTVFSHWYEVLRAAV